MRLRPRGEEAVADLGADRRNVRPVVGPEQRLHRVVVARRDRVAERVHRRIRRSEGLLLREGSRRPGHEQPECRGERGKADGATFPRYGSHRRCLPSACRRRRGHRRRAPPPRAHRRRRAPPPALATTAARARSAARAAVAPHGLVARAAAVEVALRRPAAAHALESVVPTAGARSAAIAYAARTTRPARPAAIAYAARTTRPARPAAIAYAARTTWPARPAAIAYAARTTRPARPAAIAYAATIARPATVTRPAPVARPAAVADAAAIPRSAVVTPEIVAPIGAGNVLAEFLAARVIPVRHALPMARVVLPLAAAAHVGAVEALVDVRRPVHVDVDVAAPPVAAAEDRTRGGDADAPREAGHERAARIVERRRRPVVRRIRRIAPRAVDDGRVVRRHVDHLRVRRLDLDHRLLRRRLLDDHLLLLGGLEVARLLRFLAQPLHRVEHRLLVGEERVAELLRPVELLVHRLEGLREGDERLHAHVPGLALHRLHRGVALHVRVRLHPARGLDDLERIGRGHQHLRQQRIRVEGDRRNQRLDLLRLERRRLALRLRDAAGRRGRREEHCEERPREASSPGFHA